MNKHDMFFLDTSSGFLGLKNLKKLLVDSQLCIKVGMSLPVWWFWFLRNLFPTPTIYHSRGDSPQKSHQFFLTFMII